VFSETSHDPKAMFDASRLEREIKTIVATAVVGGQSPLIQLKDPHPDLCPTFVVSTRLQASAPVRMRSYGTLDDDAFDACIWQAARATSAAPTFFLPIVINDIRYGDGGMGWNNPAKEAVLEAQNKWPGRPIGILVSIGTGLEDALSLDDNTNAVSGIAEALLKNTSPRHSFRLAVAKYAVRCVTSCELVHRELSQGGHNISEGNYFRLNVPQGMSGIGLAEWDKLDAVIALTDAYMDHGEMKKSKRRIAELLQNPQRAS
jgi:predicted acylesterase/phospholipase RssA